ncbi:hypothetical protein F5B18DRAFT_644738 [Nemania serpens]|nr:hypothetical protein F5B18DRAFT_644738 [Nemania serpens]
MVFLLRLLEIFCIVVIASLLQTEMIISCSQDSGEVLLDLNTKFETALSPGLAFHVIVPTYVSLLYPAARNMSEVICKSRLRAAL